MTNRKACDIMTTESEVTAMTVYVFTVMNTLICEVFSSEEKAYDYGNQYYPGYAWDVEEKVVQ